MCAVKTLCLYHPTTVVIVDDNKAFLESFPDNLPHATHYQLFHSPKAALEFLNQLKTAAPTATDFLGSTVDPSTGETLNIDLAKIQNWHKNSNRHLIPSVLIIDHDMPEMSGFEFCQQLGDYPIKKIMLTGAADHKLAVDAFNDGIINKFVSKDNPDVFTIIDQAIHTLQQEYFAKLSKLVIKNITSHTLSFLENPAFQQFFSDLMKAHHIVEFYLIDSVGSFLLMNQQGQQSYFIVQSAKEIAYYQEIAKDQDADFTIIDAIASKQQLLCLIHEEDFNQPVSQWHNYLYPAQKIPAVDGYYALVETIRTEA